MDSTNISTVVILFCFSGSTRCKCLPYTHTLSFFHTWHDVLLQPRSVYATADRKYEKHLRNVDTKDKTVCLWVVSGRDGKLEQSVGTTLVSLRLENVLRQRDIEVRAAAGLTRTLYQIRSASVCSLTINLFVYGETVICTHNMRRHFIVTDCLVLLLVHHFERFDTDYEIFKPQIG